VFESALYHCRGTANRPLGHQEFAQTGFGNNKLLFWAIIQCF